MNAPAPAPSRDGTLPDPHASGSVLGLVPHQIRGFLAQFRTVPIVGAAYDRCTGCSDAVVEAYEKGGLDGTLLPAFNDAEFLTRLTGLDKLYEETQAALENDDLVDGEEDDF